MTQSLEARAPAPALRRLNWTARWRPGPAIRMAGLVALIALGLSTPGFTAAPSVLSFINTASLVGCVAVGMTFITLSGNIMSFSLGATAGVAAVTFAALSDRGTGLALTATVTLAVGVNFVQGLVIGIFRANPIIVSIAALALIGGVSLRRLLADGTIRAFLLLGALLALFLGLNLAGKSLFGTGAGFSIFENFATFGPVALGLALTMLIRRFDISMAGMFSLGGCVAVLLGDIHPLLGIAAALTVGVIGGALQGIVMERLHLGSVPVTLGGLLTFFGIAYVLTGNRSVNMSDLEVAHIVNAPILGLFSVRSVTVLALFAAAAFLVAYTRMGRDMVATGSDPRAAAVAGVITGAFTVGVFATAGILYALAGALMSYSLSAASPTGLSDVTVPAVAAVILGGASLAGGTARPLGTAAGVLILCILRTGLTSLGVSPHVHELVTGAILMAVAISDGPDLMRHLYRLGLRGR